MALNISNQSLSVVGATSKKFMVVNVGPLAALGIIINVAAFTYVVYSPKIRLPLKVTLFNLIGSDCIFLTGVFVNTVIEWNESTLTFGCPVLTAMLVVPSPVSYSAVLGLAGYNFIAVYKATHFSVIVTTQRAVVVTLVSWTLILFMTILSLALGGRKAPNCSLLIQAPPAILVIFASHCLLCSFGMAALNVAVAVKLRSARSVGSVYNKNRHVENVTFNTGDTSQLPQLLSVPKYLAKHDRNTADILAVRERNVPLNARQLYADSEQTGEEFYSRQRDTSLLSIQTGLSKTSASTEDCSSTLNRKVYSVSVKHTNCVRQSITYKEDSVNTIFSFQESTSVEAPSFAYTSTNKSTLQSQNKIPFGVSDDVHPKSTSILKCNDTLIANDLQMPRGQDSIRTFSLLPSNGSNSQISNNGNICQAEAKSTSNEDIGNHSRSPATTMSKKMRTTIVTLTILAFWNAVLTLPVLGMWIWMATVEDLSQKASLEGVANVLPVLATFNSVTNPFLYAWRFVDWRKLYAACCKRHGSVSLTTGTLALESRLNSHIG